MTRSKAPSRPRTEITLRLVATTIAFLAAIFVSRSASAQVMITPPSATVSPGGTQMFTASGGMAPYTWSLMTNASGGMISAAGLYTAGATPSVTDVVLVTDSTTPTALTATANVMVGAGVTVAPATAAVAAGAMQTFTASGGTPPYTWSISTNGSGGKASITNAGVYTAGANPGTDVVRATDSVGVFGMATVTVGGAMTGAVGTSCATTADCLSGLTCVDTVCCSSACSGQCQACNTSSSMGTCVTITGAPIGTRPPCAQSDPSNACTSLACDGTSATSCTSFVGKETGCGIPSCVDNYGTLGMACDGDGGCVKVPAKPCTPYACVSSMCATKCTITSECSPGNFCDVKTGKCVLPPPVPDAGADAGGGSSSPTATAGCSIATSVACLSPLVMLASLLGVGGVRRAMGARRRPRPSVR